MNNLEYDIGKLEFGNEEQIRKIKEMQRESEKNRYKVYVTIEADDIFTVRADNAKEAEEIASSEALDELISICDIYTEIMEIIGEDKENKRSDRDTKSMSLF